MLKLYKQNAEQTQYWEAWSDEGKIVTHWGTVGSRGDSKEIVMADDDTEDGIIARESADARAAGFEVIEPIGELVVNFPLSGFGDEVDLEKRYRVEGLMNEILGWTGNGTCEGGDFANNAINIFCRVLKPEIAVHTALDNLRVEGLLQGCVLAIRQDIDDFDEEYVVKWPDDFVGDFDPTDQD